MTETDFERATVGVEKSGAQGAQNQAQHMATSPGTTQGDCAMVGNVA